MSDHDLNNVQVQQKIKCMMHQDVAQRVKNQLDELRWGPVIVHKSMSPLLKTYPPLWAYGFFPSFQSVLVLSCQKTPPRL